MHMQPYKVHLCAVGNNLFELSDGKYRCCLASWTALEGQSARSLPVLRWEVSPVSCCARTMTRTTCPKLIRVFTKFCPSISPQCFHSQLTSLVASTLAPCAMIALSNCDITSEFPMLRTMRGLKIKYEN